MKVGHILGVESIPGNFDEDVMLFELPHVFGPFNLDELIEVDLREDLFGLLDL